MNLDEFQRRRDFLRTAQAAPRRHLCRHCLQPEFSCFCAWLRPFDPRIKFIILSHPIEAYKRIATGRMSHMSLRGSSLIVGHDYSDSPELNSVLADERHFPVLLYPGRLAQNLSVMSDCDRAALVPEGRTLAVIVIDGTWSTARKTVNASANLKLLPRICFTPPRASAFRVRRQPRPECVSSIEAIHHTIELLGPACGFDRNSRQHDHLLESFRRMVDLQVDLARGRRNKRQLDSR